MAFSEYMIFTNAPLPQIFRSSFGPRSMKGNYKMVVLTGHFCANSLKVYGLYNSVAFLRSSSATENFAKKARELEKVIRLSDMEKNVQRMRTPAKICTNTRMSTMKPK